MKLMVALCGFIFITAAQAYSGEKPVIPAAVPRHQTTAKDSAAWKREPFAVTTKMNKLAVAPRKTTQSLQSEDIPLQGIISSENRYHVLIGGHVYKVGDIFEGHTILDISRYRVVMQKNKEKYIYDIHKGKIHRGEK